MTQWEGAQGPLLPLPSLLRRSVPLQALLHTQHAGVGEWRRDPGWWEWLYCVLRGG
jgi:hypothetical protein